MNAAFGRDLSRRSSPGRLFRRNSFLKESSLFAFFFRLAFLFDRF